MFAKKARLDTTAYSHDQACHTTAAEESGVRQRNARRAALARHSLNFQSSRTCARANAAATHSAERTTMSYSPLKLHTKETVIVRGPWHASAEPFV